MDIKEWKCISVGDRIIFSDRCETSTDALRRLVGVPVTVREVFRRGTPSCQVKIEEWRELDIPTDYWYPREYFSTIDIGSPDFCGLSISDFI